MERNLVLSGCTNPRTRPCCGKGTHWERHPRWLRAFLWRSLDRQGVPCALQNNTEEEAQERGSASCLPHCLGASGGPTEASGRVPGCCGHSALRVPRELFFAHGLRSPSLSPTPCSLISCAGCCTESLVPGLILGLRGCVTSST